MNFFDHIDDYKNGSLTGETLRLFEVALENDVDLQAAVENYDAAKGISEGLLELDVMGVIEGLATTKKEVKTTIFSLRNLMVAASVVGVLVFGWWMIPVKKSVDTSALFANLYEEENPMRQYRGNGQAEEGITPIQKEISLYAQKEKDFAQVQQFLLDSIENKALGKLWVAELFLEQQQLDSTLFYLPSPTTLPEQKNRIFYIKMLIAIKKGDLPQAKAYLHELPKKSYAWLYRKLEG